MKTFERIFLYSMLVVLMFYVFLADSKVESKEAIQEEIRARRIAIVNDEGQEVIMLWSHKDSDGIININDKTGTPVVIMGATKDGGAISINNKDGDSVIFVEAYKNDGLIKVYNRQGNIIGNLP